MTVPPEATRELLVFELGGARFAVPTGAVLEVVRAVTIIALPRALPFVEGVFNARGRIVPVLEIRDRFGIPPRPLAVTDHLVLLEVQRSVVALRVDAARDVIEIPASALDTNAVVARTDQLAGVAKLADGLVVVFDVSAFLSQAEAVSLAASLAQLRAESAA